MPDLPQCRLSYLDDGDKVSLATDREFAEVVRHARAASIAAGGSGALGQTANLSRSVTTIGSGSAGGDVRLELYVDAPKVVSGIPRRVAQPADAPKHPKLATPQRLQRDDTEPRSVGTPEYPSEADYERNLGAMLDWRCKSSCLKHYKRAVELGHPDSAAIQERIRLHEKPKQQ